ncbi:MULTISPECIES: hypothetical protein [Desulfonatronospira]|nr:MULTISPECIES: hypothetical protein [Desulfonatronospira]
MKTTSIFCRHLTTRTKRFRHKLQTILLFLPKTIQDRVYWKS